MAELLSNCAQGWFHQCQRFHVGICLKACEKVIIDFKLTASQWSSHVTMGFSTISNKLVTI